jgi:hypothetical protein
MLCHRLLRAYSVLALGSTLFLLWPLVLGDPLGGALPFDAAIAARMRLCLYGSGLVYCREAFVLTATVAAIGLALAGRNPRRWLPAGLLLLPPLLRYLFRYPFWIIAALLLIMPLLIDAVLNIGFATS